MDTPEAPRFRDDRVEMRVPKTAELVAARIRRQIVLGELSEDEALPSEVDLMDQFSISRPTLREALRILESEGLIAVRRGARGGARVQLPSVDMAARYACLVLEHRGTTLQDVLLARAIVEAPAARMLAERRDRKASADRLTACLEDGQRFLDFNGLVVELTNNETLTLMAAMLERISRAASLDWLHQGGSSTEPSTMRRRATKARARLVELIRSGDGPGAEGHWRLHLEQSGRVVTGPGALVVDLFP